MRSYQVVLLLTLCLAFVNHCNAKRITEPAFISYTTIDGLSLNKINHLSTSQTGVLLIATDFRANTFDGLTFHSIAATQQSAIGIKRNYQLSTGEIAIINELSELLGYNLETKQIFEFTAEKNTNVHRFFLSEQTEKGTLFLLDEENNFYRIDGREFLKLVQLNGMTVNSFSCTESQCWFANKKELLLLELSSLDISKQALPGTIEASSIIFIKYTNGNLYLRLEDGKLTVKNVDGNWVEAAQISPDIRITTLLLDQDNSLWVGTKEDGLLWKPNTEINFYSLKHDPQDRYSIPNDRIHDIKQDIFGVVWVATDRGLAKLDIPRVNMGHIRYNQSDFGLIDRDFSAIYELSSRKLVIGNRSSLTIYSENGVKERVIDSPLLTNNSTYAMTQLNNKVLWIGTENGLLTLDLESYQVKPVEIENSILNETVYSLSSLDPNLIVVGTRTSGAYVYDVANRLVLPITSKEKINEVNSIYSEKLNATWLLHSQGIGRLEETDSGYVAMSVAPLKGFNVTAMSNTETSSYWIGTKGQGLYILNSLNHSLEKFSIKNVINNPYVNGILNDGANDWISLDNSLIKINNLGESRVYSQQEGIQDIEFNLALAHKGQSGTLYFGGSQGINAINSKTHSENFKMAIPHISLNLKNSNTLSGMSRLPLEIHESLLPLKISIKSVQTRLPTKNEVRYQFSEMGLDWIYPGEAELVLPIYNLDAGEYTLTVQAKGYQADWSTEELHWRFTIQPYWWKSSWAYSLYTLLIAFLFYKLYSFRINLLKQKAELLELTVQERTEEIVSQKQVIEDQYQSLDLLTKSKEVFFENISHEFKTPLTLIMGPIKKLLDKHSHTEDSKLFQLIDRNAHRVLDMVEQLLTISRLKSGLADVVRTRIQLNQFIKAKLDEFEYLIEQKKLQVVVDGDTNVQVLIDRDSLDKILNNLLSNAIKYNIQSGYIKVHSSVQNSQIQLDITNSIPEDENIASEHFFKRFYREGSLQKGSGIGLAFTQDLVEQNSGKITVFQSNHKEITFQLSLELDEELVEMVKNDKDVEPIPKTSDIKILLIEDDEDMRFYIKQVLAEYTIETAADGVEGIKMARKLIPDIIISDIMMPRLDGYGVAAELANHELTSHIPLILLTAKSSTASKIKGFKAGALEYLNKPFDANELRLRLASIIKLQQQSKKGYRLLLSPNISQTEIVIDRDKAFVKLCFVHLESNYETATFDSSAFAKLVNMSERQFQRKTKALFELNPSSLIKEYRLKKAAEKLMQGFEVTSVCFGCGFNDTAHFSRSFKQKYQLSPSKYKQINV